MKIFWKDTNSIFFPHTHILKIFIKNNKSVGKHNFRDYTLGVK